MSLQLLKIESGLCGGEVLYHSFGEQFLLIEFIYVGLTSLVTISHWH